MANPQPQDKQELRGALRCQPSGFQKRQQIHRARREGRAQCKYTIRLQSTNKERLHTQTSANLLDAHLLPCGLASTAL